MTLGEALQANGYQTGFFGKWHLGAMTTEVIDGRFGGPDALAVLSPPTDFGFDRVFATESRVPTYDPMLRPANRQGATAKRQPPETLPEDVINRRWWEPVEPDNAVFWGTHYWSDGEMVPPTSLRGDDSKIIVDEAISFIEDAAESESPFLAVLWMHTPHTPLVASPEDQGIYSELDFYERKYFGAITAMDREIGRLRQSLKQSGVSENTVIWFMSDNGPEYWKGIGPGSTNGLRGTKRSLFEGGIRVPGIVEWPARIPPGQSLDIPAATSDVFPTILSWTNTQIEFEHAIDGENLAPIIAGDVPSRQMPIGFESTRQLALISDDYKLIYAPEIMSEDEGNPRFGQTQKTDQDFELYRIDVDPNETQSVAESHPDIVAKMTRDLNAWRQSVEASILDDEKTAIEINRRRQAGWELSAEGAR